MSLTVAGGSKRNLKNEVAGNGGFKKIMKRVRAANYETFVRRLLSSSSSCTTAEAAARIRPRRRKDEDRELDSQLNEKNKTYSISISLIIDVSTVIINASSGSNCLETS